MNGTFKNIVISALAGGAAALGVLHWKGELAPKPVEPPAAEQAAATQFEELQVDRLKVTGGIWVCHSETGEPLIELKDGVILAKNEVLSRYVGGLEMVGRKLQITTGDPSTDDPPIFCEIGAGDGGQGAYIAMLSPKGTHSVNVGFDKNETGFVVSRNNDDAAMTAQAVMPIPHKEAESAPAAEPAPAAPSDQTAAAAAPTAETTAAAPTTGTAAEPAPGAPAEKTLLSDAEPAPPTRLAMTPSDGAESENRIPGGLPMLTPSNPK
ncbi:MAG: hypothetical protein J6S40_08425 [Thermoguttaceae bacterium]|nr:hypothetical protein [Thermoguttaceae bacterium]